MPTLQFHTADAFTSQPFAGNPASVIVLDDAAAFPDATLQNIAREFNYAETAFTSADEGHTAEDPKFLLRWFTPTVEVPLCGHATLATAAILFSPHSPSPISPSASHITFRTLKSGNLVAHRRERGKIALDFPASMGVLEGRKTEGEEFAVVKKAVESAAPGLKGAVRAVAWGGFGPIVEIDPEVGIEGVEVDASYFTKEVATFFLTLTQAAPSSTAYDVYSRVFAPLAGIDEDSVTGAAHTVIGPYWLASPARAGLRSDKFAGSATREKGEVLACKQVSARGGEMEVIFDGEGRVELVGEARVMMKGELSF